MENITLLFTDLDRLFVVWIHLLTMDAQASLGCKSRVAIMHGFSLRKILLPVKFLRFCFIA